ncbi:hypothetical protein B0189_02225 [Moraxella cuniculi]|nr:hypothetical protein B0189_02225 [Moraxella cuniculi]
MCAYYTGYFCPVNNFFYFFQNFFAIYHLSANITNLHQNTTHFFINLVAIGKWQMLACQWLT